MFIHFTFLFKERFYYYFIFGCTGSSLLRLSLVAVCGLLLAAASSLMEHGLYVLRLQQLQPMGSVVVAHRLQSVPYIGRWILSHWITREAPLYSLIFLGKNFLELWERHVDIGNFVLSPDGSAWIRLVQNLFVCPPTHPLPFTHPPRFIKHLLFSQHYDKYQGYRDE